MSECVSAFLLCSLSVCCCQRLKSRQGGYESPRRPTAPLSCLSWYECCIYDVCMYVCSRRQVRNKKVERDFLRLVTYQRSCARVHIKFPLLTLTPPLSPSFLPERAGSHSPHLSLRFVHTFHEASHRVGTSETNPLASPTLLFLLLL